MEKIVGGQNFRKMVGASTKMAGRSMNVVGGQHLGKCYEVYKSCRGVYESGRGPNLVKW